jgi:hypothetical protein
MGEGCVLMYPLIAITYVGNPESPKRMIDWHPFTSKQTILLKTHA